jgi:hypothetical protein
MSKLTAMQIGDRVTRVLASLHRSLDRGEITEAQLTSLGGLPSNIKGCLRPKPLMPSRACY